jgi:hypothetical protein
MAKKRTAKRKHPSSDNLVARGTPHQWAYANVLAHRFGFRRGVGEVMRRMNEAAKPKKFEAGVRQMSITITGLEKGLGIRRSKSTGRILSSSR